MISDETYDELREALLDMADRIERNPSLYEPAIVVHQLRELAGIDARAAHELPDV